MGLVAEMGNSADHCIAILLRHTDRRSLHHDLSRHLPGHGGLARPQAGSCSSHFLFRILHLAQPRDGPPDRGIVESGLVTPTVADANVRHNGIEIVSVWSRTAIPIQTSCKDATSLAVCKSHLHSPPLSKNVVHGQGRHWCLVVDLATRHGAAPDMHDPPPDPENPAGGGSFPNQAVSSSRVFAPQSSPVRLLPSVIDGPRSADVLACASSAQSHEQNMPYCGLSDRHISCE